MRWCCWFGSRKDIRPVKNWVVGCWCGYLSGDDLHMVQLMPLPLTVSCLSKIQISINFLVSAHPGSPGKRAVKRVCVCVSRSLCWASSISSQHDAASICCWAPAPAARCPQLLVDISCRHGAQQQTYQPPLLLWINRTDRRTDAWLLHSLCSARQVGNVKNHLVIPNWQKCATKNDLAWLVRFCVKNSVANSHAHLLSQLLNVSPHCIFTRTVSNYFNTYIYKTKTCCPSNLAKGHVNATHWPL